MAPRVARCCHRGARALLPPARHQAGLLGRPRAPRVPAEMGDRRGARYAPFRLPFSPRTRAFAFFASPVGRAKAATRARDLRVGEFRDERAHRFARDGPLLTSPSPTPLAFLLLSAARPPPIANLVKELETLRYRWAYRVVDLPGAYPLRRHDTSRSNRGTGAVRGMATRSSSRHARRRRPPRPAGFPPFSKALSPTIAYPTPIAFPKNQTKRRANRGAAHGP